MSESNSNQDLDSLLDVNIDDLADMPEFTVFPNGVHRVVIKWERKEVNSHPCVELKMTAVETVELADPGKDTPLSVGAESSVLFMMDNEFGQGSFKAVIKPIAQHLGASKISDAMDQSNGMEVEVTCKVRTDKKTKNTYTGITKVSI